jgi:aminopeptidase C
MMEEVYRITGICLGIPPTQFTWQYVDKAKQVRRHFLTSVSVFREKN